MSVKAVTALDTARANLVRTAEAREVIDRGPDARKASQLRLHALKKQLHMCISSACVRKRCEAPAAADTHASAMELEDRRSSGLAAQRSRLMPERGDGRPTRRPRHR